MRICIDSCVFINGLTGADPDAARLLELIGPDLVVVIPRLVAQEVTRNLQTAGQVHRFYRLFHQRTFAEWMHASHLISDKHRFLRDRRRPLFGCWSLRHSLHSERPISLSASRQPVWKQTGLSAAEKT